LPTESETRVELKSTVDQCGRGGKVFTEVAKNSGGRSEDLGIISGYCNRATSEIDALASVRAAVVRPASEMEYVVAKRGECESGSVTPIQFDSFASQIETLEVYFFSPFPRPKRRNSTKV
jgi:hypothetical protein